MSGSNPEECKANPGQQETMNLRAIAYLKGEVKGQGNAAINFGKVGGALTSPDQQTSGDLEKKAKAAKLLAEAVRALDDSSNGSAGDGNGTTIRGLAVITGKTEGNGNGAVNFDHVVSDVQQRNAPVENVASKVPVKDAPEELLVRNIAVEQGPWKGEPRKLKK